MPGRVSTRSSRPSAADARNASISTSVSRGSTDSRQSSVPTTNVPTMSIPPETADSALRMRVCGIFRDAQRNTASHRKLVIGLRKVQESCCDRPADEQAFQHEFARCILRIMPIRKAETVGDKAIRFVGLFLRHAHDRDNERVGGAEDDTGDAMPETPSTRLTAHLMETVLPLLTAKDKFVRYRSTQLISHVINCLDAIDDGLFQRLRHALLKRIRDKEAMIRAQAVLGLGRLAGNEVDGADDSAGSDDDDDVGLLDKLLSVLQNDPSADVRRSLLVNLPILSNTLPALLERARDQDAAARRAVYSRLLPALGDFRHLSLSMREKLLRWGLRDRDENVRKAAQLLFRDRWIEDCAGARPEEGSTPAPVDAPAPAPAPAPDFDALLELLERIDVVNSGLENGIALEAMESFWDGRPDYRDAVVLDDYFWETLSAESVFMARSFNSYCRNAKNVDQAALLDEKLPEITKIAFFIERYLGVLVDAIIRVSSQADGDDGDDDEDTVEPEFIVEQLLHIASTLDFSDEVGRRKMFALLRQTLSIPELPEEVTKLTIDVLRQICAPDAAGEREFCGVVLESVADVHDTVVDEAPAEEDPDDSFHSARSDVSGDHTPTRGDRSGRGRKGLSEEAEREQAIKEIVINMKCLHMVQCMLCNVGGTLQHNDHLVSMLNNLVVPAVRSHEAPVREKGLVCLGLCALLDKSLAEENLNLFMHFFTKGHVALQITALHILTDILNVHGAQLLQANPALVKVYIKALKMGSRSSEVQAAATVAVSKLLLGRVVIDVEASRELLKSLVVAYFDPSSADNHAVRQALNYFLPVFCYSRPENQALVQSVALDAIHALFNLKDGLEDDDAGLCDGMASLTTIGACLVDWTDPRKCYSRDAESDAEKNIVSGDVHLDFAQDILAKLRGAVNKEEKKIIAGLLGKLHISPGSTVEKIEETYGQVVAAIEEQLVSDTTSKNALYKIHVSLGKIVNILADTTVRQLSRSTSIAMGEDKATPLSRPAASDMDF